MSFCVVITFDSNTLSYHTLDLYTAESPEINKFEN